MFPLHQGGELCFKISPSPHRQDNIPQDLIPAQYAEIHGSDMITSMENGRRRNLTSMDSNEVARDNKNNSMKKMMHRVIERQRRQEMAIHHASLRALLPLEFIRVTRVCLGFQGKRSISDHMNEAVNYVKYLQKKIREISAKRDGLKKLSNSSFVASPSGSSNKYSSSSLALHPYPGGIEITFDSDHLMGRDLPLSKVLQVLVEEGISVINCVSTKVNERLFHSVQTEVNDPTCLNLSELRQKLTLLVSSTSDLSK
ncbi:hypothetical protein DKX38_023152 [Salix brachista]|uniref:BHLH domain-containing protein n=1 Tax=Salix brachista TaxID=2182728 RepID=A0A5N5K609_9ROSI|nr:hypothetical protein DKX38_023152 [Salix brachista]